MAGRRLLILGGGFGGLDVARAIAESFYRRVFAGKAPAAVIREERAKFTAKPPPKSATWMAYIFFGHPRLRLQRPRLS